MNSNILIIARSINDHPLAVFVEKYSELFASLKPNLGSYNRPLWYERKVLYRYDEGLFQELRTAYIRKDNEKLRTIWERAIPWEP